MAASRGNFGRLAVVGGAGVIGRALVECAAASGRFAGIIAIDRQRPAAHDSRCDWCIADMRDLNGLVAALDGIDRVVHLAGLKLADQSAHDPLEYFQVNGMGTANLMNAARLAGVDRVVYASTSHVYGAAGQAPLSEDLTPAPASIYAASKLAGEAAVLGFGAAYGLPVTIARLANVYGGTADPHTVVGKAVIQARSGGPIALREHQSVRDFVSLADAAEALLRLVCLGDRSSQTVNIGSGHGTAAGEIAHAVAKAAQLAGLGPIDVVDPAVALAPDSKPRFLANERLKSLTGFEPTTSWEAGLAALFSL